MASQSDKLEQLAEIEGFDDVLDFIDEYIIDSVCPGICMNDGCDYTTVIEPDGRHGWCEECGTNTVMSGIELSMETGL